MKSEAFIVIERTDLLVLTMWIPLVLITIAAYVKFSVDYAQQLLPRIKGTWLAIMQATLATVEGFIWETWHMELNRLMDYVIRFGIGFAYIFSFLAFGLLIVEKSLRRWRTST